LRDPRPPSRMAVSLDLRYLYFFIDLDDNDDNGVREYSGAELYVEAEFHSNPTKLNNTSYYIYSGEGDERYRKYHLILKSNNSSGFNDVFELKIPLTVSEN